MGELGHARELIVKPHVAVLAVQLFIQPIAAILAVMGDQRDALLVEAAANGASAAASYLATQGE